MNDEKKRVKAEEVDQASKETSKIDEIEIGEEEKNADDETKESETEAEEKSSADSAEEEALNVKYMRLMADFQNYKKRVEKEKSDIYAYGNEKIVLQLLDVIDNFERALEHHSSDTGYEEGMNMIFKQLTGVLEKAGLQEINALGEDFDPNYHNAVMTEDNPDFESGKVTEVMQKGYLLNSKVIRPSMVKVNN